MTGFTLHLAAALAAGLGAVARLLLDGVISAAVARRTARGGRAGALPWGTLAVNLSGALLIGIAAGLFVTGFTGGSPHVDTWQAAVALGFLGGYTTFSTASYQTMRLVRERRWGLAIVNGLAQLLCTVVLVALGWWLTTLG